MADAYHESAAHQGAKQVIAEACAAAGFAVTLEAAGSGWRADVLAERGAVRLAFEVQWSPLALSATLERQARYAADGVRGCWFFRRAPGGAPTAHDAMPARRDLPLFQVVANADASFQAYVNQRLLDLGGFVASLVAGQVRFCEQAAFPPALEAEFGLFALACPACGRAAFTPKPIGPIAAACGALLTAEPAWARAALAGQASAAALSAAAGGLPVMLGDRCPQCAAPAPERTLWAASYGVQPRHRVRAIAPLPAGLAAPHPHWCLGGAHGWCG